MAELEAAGRLVLPDADYLLSMIMAGVDESKERTDKFGRFHTNIDGAQVYRESDVVQKEGDARPAPGVELLGTPAERTLERRRQSMSDVERRKAEAEDRKREAAERSLNRRAKK